RPLLEFCSGSWGRGRSQTFRHQKTCTHKIVSRQKKWELDRCLRPSIARLVIKVLENASAGLHADAFALVRKYVSSGAKVLDLGSGPGAWVRRLHDASYAVTACGFTAPKERFGFPYYQLDSNQNFATGFESEAFDVVCIVEVI